MPVARSKQLATRLFRQSLAIIWLIILVLLAVDIMVDYQTHRQDTLNQIQLQVSLIENPLANTLFYRFSTLLREEEIKGERRYHSPIHTDSIRLETGKYEVIPFTEQAQLKGKVISIIKNGYWKPIR